CCRKRACTAVAAPPLFCDISSDIDFLQQLVCDSFCFFSQLLKFLRRDSIFLAPLPQFGDLSFSCLWRERSAFMFAWVEGRSLNRFRLEFYLQYVADLRCVCLLFKH